MLWNRGLVYKDIDAIQIRFKSIFNRCTTPLFALKILKELKKMGAVLMGETPILVLCNNKKNIDFLQKNLMYGLR